MNNYTVINAYVDKIFFQTLELTIIEPIETLPDQPQISRIVLEFGEVKLRELIHAPFQIAY